MISFWLTFLIVTTKTSGNFFARGSSRWNAVRYSGLGDDYIRLLKSLRISPHFFPLDLNKADREETCKEITNAIIFQYLRRGEGWPVSVAITDHDYDVLTARVEQFYRQSLLSSFHKFLLKVEIDRNIILVDAVPCSIEEKIGDAWFLAAGFDEDSLLVLVKRQNYENYSFMGIVELSPTLDSLHLDEADLEKKFLLDLKDATDSSPRRSVCSLSTAQRFRLCSNIFRVYQNEKNPEYVYAVNHVKGEPRCLEKTRISFAYADPASMGVDIPVHVDLLTCAVNQEYFSPNKFFLTVDPRVWHAVYVLELQIPEHSSGSPGRVTEDPNKIPTKVPESPKEKVVQDVNKTPIQVPGEPVEGVVEDVDSSSSSSEESWTSNTSTSSLRSSQKGLKKVKFFLFENEDESYRPVKREYFLAMRIQQVNLLRLRHVRF